MCPGFGCVEVITFLRALYHSQTRSGFRMNESKFANSSGLNFFQIPSSPRNVGTPLSADIPAPVKTATEFAVPSFDIRRWEGSCTGKCGDVLLGVCVKISSVRFE